MIARASKNCSNCGESKPIGEFPLLLHKASGKRYPRSYCADCHRARQRQYAKGKRQPELDPILRLVDQRDAEIRYDKMRLPAEDLIARERRINAHAKRVQRDDPEFDLSTE